MKKKNLLQLLAIMMMVMLSAGFASCSSDDDNDSEPDIPNEQPVPDTPFVIQLYSFEKGIGSNMSAFSSGLLTEGIEGRELCGRVTNADSTIYKSIIYEQYPTTGQGAQGLKEITVILADGYPATTEQLVEYLQQRHKTISSGEDIWEFSNTVDPDKQKYVLTFTAPARKLVYTYVNEPLFRDFGRYLGTDIKKVGWGSIDASGNFLTYKPHGLLDGYIWQVSMFGDWAPDGKGGLQNWREVKSVTVQFELDQTQDRIDSIIDYLNHAYVYYGSWEAKNGYGHNYYDEDKTMIITFRHRYDMQQEDRHGTIRIGALDEVLYSPYKE